MSGGGAQSVLMGATGDSTLYAPYLTAIGAQDASDAVLGSMGWCPITGLDVADEAYEWMMGATRDGLTEEEQAISNSLAAAFATYVNEAGITDENGSTLSLDESEDGIHQAGSYYQRVLRAIETSLNDFLKDTEFPYDASAASAGMGGPGGGGPDGMGRPGGAPSPDGNNQDNVATDAANSDTDTVPDESSSGTGPGPDGGTGGARRGAGGPAFLETDGTALPDTGEDAPTDDADLDDAEGIDEVTNSDYEAIDDISRTQNSGGVSLSGTYETAADYIDALNADGEWVSYDETTNTATVESVASFCAALKHASKGLGAFDQLDRGQGENTLFGVGGAPAHFDATLARILEEQGNTYAADYAADIKLVDTQGSDMQTRVNMYTPLYYLLSTSEGHGTSQPAKHWRIRSGINQGDTALTTELNLAMALQADNRVESVDFAAVWGQGHTQAERTGTAEENFIAWVKGCLA